MLKNIFKLNKLMIGKQFFSMENTFKLAKPNHEYLMDIHSCINDKEIKFNYKNPDKLNHVFKLKEIKIPFDKKIKPIVILKSIYLKNDLEYEENNNLEIEENEIIKKKFDIALEFLGIKDINEYISYENADLICKLFNLNLVNEFSKNKEYSNRAPLISIMGHVDHGKTTLLDTYRNSSIADGEIGGITQKIGGFTVESKFGNVSFIDTPGHALFSNMRHRGAILTDIIILVISAVEGIQNQTLEVLNLIKKYNIPVIIAINKIDSIKADPEKVEEQLINLGIELEEYGGNVPCVHISAKEKMNTDLLLELILYESEKLKIKGSKNLNTEIFALESSNSKLREQKSTSIIIKNGTINKGDYLIIKNKLNKCLNLKNDKSMNISKGECGNIVELFGINNLPDAGDFLTLFKEEKHAKKFIKLNQFIEEKIKEDENSKNIDTGKWKFKFKNYREKRKVYSGKKEIFLNKIDEKIEYLEKKLFNTDNQLNEEEKKKINDDLNEIYKIKNLYNNTDNNELNLIIKTRDYGILETIINELNTKKYQNIKLLKIEVGPINNNDLFLAENTNGKIISMDVEIDDKIKIESKEKKIDLIYHNIIYNLFKDIEDINIEFQETLKNKLPIGNLTVKKIIAKKGKNKNLIIGCFIDSGKVILNSKFNLIRNNKKIKSNIKINSLKYYKNEVEELEEGKECGMSFINCSNFEENDILECYQN